MKNENKNKIYRKMVLITKIKYVREIVNYLLDNFSKEKIRLEFFIENTEE